MSNNKGFGVISIIFLVCLVAVAGLGSTIFIGQAPQCKIINSDTRSGKEISDELKTGQVTISDSEATIIAQNYIGSEVENGKICFSEGLAHLSGKKKLGALTASFYVSSGVDLKGSVPIVTNLDIQLGSLPKNPVISTLIKGLINKMIADNLSSFELTDRYSIAFAEGTATITKY